MKLSLFFGAAARVFLDCLFCWLGWLIAVTIFMGTVLSNGSFSAAASEYVLVMAANCAVVFSVCGVYKGLWQHPGLGSVIRLAVAVFLVSVTAYVFVWMGEGVWLNPGIALLAFYIMFSLCLVVRIFNKTALTVRAYLRRFYKNVLHLPKFTHEPVRTLLVGAGESASTFLLHKSQQGARPREILGILDSDCRKHGHTLHGTPVLGDDSRIPQLVKQLHIDEIVVAIPSMNNEELRRIIKLTPVNRCKVRMLCGLSPNKASDMLRDINIGDLLGRPENVLNTEIIGAWVKNKTVLITGGGGSIGSEICRQLIRFDVKQIVIYEISENNAFNLNEELLATFREKAAGKVSVRIGSVQDENRLNEVFGEVKPQIIFHAAAYKHVPLMENCPRLAFENNTLSTYLTAKCANRHGVERFVMISTDKAVNPTSVMGATKRLAELVVLGTDAQNSKHKTRYVCVRFGNVLESNGSVIPTFKRQIAAGGPVTLTHPEMLRYFMTMPEAAQLVLEAGAMAGGGEIFILNMGQPVKIIDLAENLIRMAGLTPNVDINIEISGLRPGEKLYEELLLNEEGLTTTLNDKIFVVKPPTCPNFNTIIGRLENYSKTTPTNGNQVRNMLKDFIPEYKGGT